MNNVKVYGLAESILASGYPMKTKMPSPKEFKKEVDDINLALAINDLTNPNIKRAFNLGQTERGEGHDNFLNGIVVQFDLDFPIKLWVEAQRYHFLDFVSSSSTMHKLKDFDISLCVDDSVDNRIIEILKEKQQKYRESPSKENYLELLMSAPVGLKLFARMTTNYRQLKTMHNQRKKHRLPHWQEFTDWAESLPYFKELTGSD
jgi:hypothetical protein